LNEKTIEKLLEKNNGILKTADVVAVGISKEYFYQYVKRSGMQKAAHGIYLSSDAWADEMYLLQAQFQKAVYSHETALYLHDLAEKEPMPLTVTVAANYNGSGLVKKGVKVFFVKKEWYEMGVCELRSPGGFPVKVYDMERTICDILRKRSEMDIAVFNYAVKEYIKREDKDYTRLGKYATTMRLERKLNEFMGVLF